MKRKPRLSLDAKKFKNRERERIIEGCMMESLKFGFVVRVFCKERSTFSMLHWQRWRWLDDWLKVKYVRNTEFNSIVFHSKRIYMSAFI